MFTWTPEMIRFMEDASDYCNYHKTLASVIAEALPERGSVCDAGCGLGFLSLALAGYCGTVTAADASHEALEVLRRRAAEQQVKNIVIREGDIASLPPGAPYDAMVFCFFGSTGEILRLAKAQCRGRIAVFKKNWEEHRFTLGRKKLTHETYAVMCRRLSRLGIPYESRTFSLEMGQPLRSLQDAVTFFQIYNKDETHAVTPEEVEKRLIRQDSETYPYYLPQEKRMGMIVLDTGDLPEPIDTLVK